MKLFTLRHDIVCREAVELVTDYLEGRLSRRDRGRFEAHLGACDGCEEYVRQIKATIGSSAASSPRIWRRRPARGSWSSTAASAARTDAPPRTVAAA